MTERPAKRFYEFDTFRVDIEERQLLCGAMDLELTPKVFDLLLTLIENKGRTVEKSELMERVWADTYVDEGNLNRNISTLRRILGDDRREPRFIRTIPKRGYRFDGDVREIIEEGQETVVERRINYSVSLMQRSGAHARSSFPLSAVVAVAAGLILVSIVVWVIIRTSAREVGQPSVPGRSSTNVEAQDIYVKARAKWDDRSVEGLHDATIELERAVALDPDFALAHAALADAYAFDVNLWKKAEETAAVAIRLDPTLGQPYSTIGFVRTFWERRLDEADAYFKRAILLDPEYATAHQWYALNLTARSQGGSSLAEMKKALDLNPGSPSINADLCQVLYYSRKYDLAIEQCRKTLSIDPNFLAAHQHLYDIYTAKKMYPEAVREFLRYEELSMTTRSFPDQLEKLKRTYETGGIRAFWRERIAMQKSDACSTYSAGRYYARLGDHEAAMRCFERALDSSEFDLIFFAVDPANASLLADPRAAKLRSDLYIPQSPE